MWLCGALAPTYLKEVDSYMYACVHIVSIHVDYTPVSIDVNLNMLSALRDCGLVTMQPPC